MVLSLYTAYQDWISSIFNDPQSSPGMIFEYRAKSVPGETLGVT